MHETCRLPNDEECTNVRSSISVAMHSHAQNSTRESVNPGDGGL